MAIQNCYIIYNFKHQNPHAIAQENFQSSEVINACSA